MTFILFWGDYYYPGGGATDSHKMLSTLSLDFALRRAKQHLDDEVSGADWAHLARVDRDRLTIVAEWDRDQYGRNVWQPTSEDE